LVPGSSIRTAITSEYLGVGFIIGPGSRARSLPAVFFSWLVLMPAIRFFGQNSTVPLLPLDDSDSPDDSGPTLDHLRTSHGCWRGRRFRLITLIRTIPTIVAALASGLKDVRAQARRSRAPDQPASTGIFDEVRSDWFSRYFGYDVGAATFQAPTWSNDRLVCESCGWLFVLVFGFLFVTVSCRICGLIGTYRIR